MLDIAREFRENTEFISMNPYQISREGQPLGEFVESQILEGLQTGYFQPTDWCWREGMSEWQGLSMTFQPPTKAPPARQASAAVNPYAPPRQGVRRATATPQRAVSENASPGVRLGAVVLDNLAFFACVMPAAFMSSGTVTTEGDKTLLMIIGLLFLSVLLTNLFLMGMFGQTIGKKMLGIRIVSVETGSKAGFFQIVLLRNFVAQGLLYIVPFFGLVDICYIFSEDHRCLHDKIAGTKVLLAA